MRPLLIALHLLLALTVLVCLVRQLGVRAQEVSDIRGLANREHRDTERMQQETALQQHLLAGIRAKDPYVVELLARERLGYARPNEFAPPALSRPGTP
jgi:hypothetical protein